MGEKSANLVTLSMIFPRFHLSDFSFLIKKAA
jgi:hypothetical protein